MVWLTFGLAVFGVVVLQARVGPTLNSLLPASSLAAVTWALYALPFIFVVARLDLLEPEPPGFLASAFGWGALVATPIALVANESGRGILSALWGADFALDWTGALVGPVTEEVMKGLGVVVVVLVARRQVTTVLDGIVYGAFVGLGLQVTENFIVTLDSLTSYVRLVREPVEIVGDTFVYRGLELGLWSHTVYTACAGFGIAYWVVESHRSAWHRTWVAAGSVLAGAALHFVWNAPFTQPADHASHWGALPIYVVKGVPALVLLMVLAAYARGREVSWFAGALRDEDVDVVPLVDRETLRTRRARRDAIVAARTAGGRAAAAACRRLQRAQVALAVVRATGADAVKLDAARSEVRAARAALDAAT